MPVGPYIAPQSSTVASLDTNNMATLSRLMGNWIQADPSWLSQIMPLLESLKAHGNVQLRDLPPGQRSSFNPLANTVNVSSFRAIPHELGHQEQVAEGGVIPTSLLNFLQLMRFGDKGRYSAPGTLEWRSDNARVPLITSLYNLRGR